MKLTNHQIAQAGKHAVLSRLNLLGQNPDFYKAGRQVRAIINNGQQLKVVTSHKPSKDKDLFGNAYEWLLSVNDQTVNEDLFYIFVSLDLATADTRQFIVPSSIVADYIARQHQLWLNYQRAVTDEKIPMRTFRIGLDDNQLAYPIATPLAKDFENQWAIITGKN